MTRASFIAQVQDIIEEVMMSQQSIGDLWGDVSPKEAARDIADLVPAIAWSDE